MRISVGYGSWSIVTGHDVFRAMNGEDIGEEFVDTIRLLCAAGF